MFKVSIFHTRINHLFTDSFALRYGLIHPFCDLNKVIPEIGFNGAVDLAYFGAEYNFIELRHHIALAEFAQIAAGPPGRT